MLCVPDLMSAYQHGRHRPRDRAGGAAGDDRALRADGRPDGHPRPAARAERPAGEGVAGRQGRLRLGVRGALLPRGSRPPNPANGEISFMPPSGHIAGIWGRNDDTRGVHKAPANEVIRGAISLEMQFTKNEHDLLNPVGINVVRSFPGRGNRVWGARTLSSDPAWRYLNVRRLFNYLEESILVGTNWVVFEPNDEALWARVRRTHHRVPGQRVAQGGAVRADPRRGLLRQVRLRDQPQRGHRRRTAGVRGRCGAGQAGRVRGLPPGAVLRRHQPGHRVAPTHHPPRASAYAVRRT